MVTLMLVVLVVVISIASSKVPPCSNKVCTMAIEIHNVIRDHTITGLKGQFEFFEIILHSNSISENFRSS